MGKSAKPLFSIILTAIPAIIVDKQVATPKTAAGAMPARAFHSQAGCGKQLLPVNRQLAGQGKQKGSADIIGRQRQERLPINLISQQPGMT